MTFMWEVYSFMASRRQTGMAANPLTLENLEALERRWGFKATAWQANVIFRVDDAVLLIINKVPTKPETASQAETVSTKDAAGVKGLIRGILKRKKGGS